MFDENYEQSVGENDKQLGKDMDVAGNEQPSKLWTPHEASPICPSSSQERYIPANRLAKRFKWRCFNVFLGLISAGSFIMVT